MAAKGGACFVCATFHVETPGASKTDRGLGEATGQDSGAGRCVESRPRGTWRRAGAQGSRGVQLGGRRSQAAAGEDGRGGRGSGWT